MLLTLGTAGPARADDPAPGQLTLAASIAPSDHYVAGDTITYTYTATNNTGAPFTFPDGEGLEIYTPADYDAGHPAVTGGDCQLDGFEDWGYPVYYTYYFPAAGTLADGASLTCTLTYTASATDAQAGRGLWTMFVYSPVLYSDTWSYGEWDSVPAAGTPDRPAISGTASVGSTLTVGPWFFDPFEAPLTYQWLRNGSPIPSATKSTYVPAAADLGATLSVRVDASELGITWDSAATAVVGAGHLAPTVPAVTGAATVGSTLTASPGAWKPAGITYRYQWYRGGSPVAGATRAAYALTASDLGKTLTVKVTGTKAGYLTASATSRTTASVKAGTITITKAAAITGVAKVGKKLTAVKPKVSVSGASYSYRWLRSGKSISGATKSTYTLKAADKGKTVTVKVTVKKAGYTSIRSTAKKVGPIRG